MISRKLFHLVVCIFCCSAANAEIPKIFQTINQLNCKASKLIQGHTRPVGDIQIRVDREGELLIEASFTSDRKQNFKFGRRFVSGRTVAEQPETKCSYFFDEESEFAAQVKYVCSDFDTPSASARDGFSQFFYRSHLSTGAICKSSGACWELTDCK